jgi:hypothetical protein
MFLVLKNIWNSLPSSYKLVENSTLETEFRKFAQVEAMVACIWEVSSLNPS